MHNGSSFFRATMIRQRVRILGWRLPWPEGSIFLARQPYSPKGSTFSLCRQRVCVFFSNTLIRQRVQTFWSARAADKGFEFLIFGRRGPSPEGSSFCWHANLIRQRVRLFRYAAKGLEFFQQHTHPTKGSNSLVREGCPQRVRVFSAQP